MPNWIQHLYEYILILCRNRPVFDSSNSVFKISKSMSIQGITLVLITLFDQKQKKNSCIINTTHLYQFHKEFLRIFFRKRVPLENPIVLDSQEKYC